MIDLPISSDRVIERLGRKELELKRLGQVNQAAGVRLAIVTVLQEAQDQEAQQAAQPGHSAAIAAVATSLTRGGQQGP